MIREKHGGGLIGHFGVEKTIKQLNEGYFWPRMSADVKKLVQGCRIF